MMYTVCGSGPVDKQGEDGELLCAAVHKHYQGNEEFFFSALDWKEDKCWRIRQENANKINKQVANYSSPKITAQSTQ